jgi:D-alanyl-lipoteichoic acid acyltransferase DltB (MBOAT superfamily)
VLFNSIAFLVFFPIVTLGYFLLPPRLRWAWLVAASAIFYMAFVPYYILILLAVIGVDYVAGRLIEPATGPRRRALLAVSICTNVLFLCVFKYYNFGVENVTATLGALGIHVRPPLLSIVLPIGLSFHTFQSMSYTIEVYRGKVPAERHLGVFALYVLFYPQLVAGPIERPQNLLEQFHSAHPFQPDKIVGGLRLMLWGFVKKVVVADRLAELVNVVYAAPDRHSGPALLLAAYLFSFQIYCDFSGYSDIARGAARVMGYELMVNFRRPYFATSMGEFWRRWHISLSTWFRDYVFVPLGGSRVSSALRLRNIMIVFLLSGLWHGAAWHYVAWGAINGVLVAIEGTGSRDRAKPQGVDRLVRILFIFHLATLAWIFFRAESIGDAWVVLRRLPTGWGHSPALELGSSTGRIAGILALVVGLVFVDWTLETGSLPRWFAARPRWTRWALYYAAITIVVFYGASTTARFIYFQF